MLELGYLVNKPLHRRDGERQVRRCVTVVAGSHFRCFTFVVWIDARERVVYQEWDQFWWKHFSAVIASVAKHSSLLLGRCRRIASASGLAGEEISHLISLEGCIITGDG